MEKIKLNDLNLESFITQINQKELRGGTGAGNEEPPPQITNGDANEPPPA